MLVSGLILNLAAAEAHANPLIAQRPDLVEEFLVRPIEPVGGHLFSGEDFPIGHGSLSGSVYRVDPDHDLVVAIGRYESGEKHGEFLSGLLLLVSGHMKE